MESTEKSQHFLYRLGRVGVVHDDTEWLPDVNSHHSSWNWRRRRQCGGDRFQLDTCPKRYSGRTERIRDIELADERQRACRTTVCTSIKHEGAANAARPNIECTQIGIGP